MKARRRRLYLWRRRYCGRPAQVDGFPLLQTSLITAGQSDSEVARVGCHQNNKSAIRRRVATTGNIGSAEEGSGAGVRRLSSPPCTWTRDLFDDHRPLRPRLPEARRPHSHRCRQLDDFRCFSWSHIVCRAAHSQEYVARMEKEFHSLHSVYVLCTPHLC